MKGLVPTQPLGLKAGQRVGDHFLAQRDLVFHHDVDDRMQLSVWKSNLLVPMIRGNEFNSLTFIQCQPFNR